jgi:hypothetical protein
VRIAENVPPGVLAQLDDAIRQLVAGAIKNHRVVRSGPEAERLASEYRRAGLSKSEIADLVARAASAAGVTTELRPRGPR